MNSDEKKCPRCAEIVKAEATVCRHCGYDFETRDDLSTKTAKAHQQQKANQALFGCFGTIVILGLLYWWISGDPEPTPTPSAEKASYSISADQLAAAYQQDLSAAQARYGDAVLAVSGSVKGVDVSDPSAPVVTVGSQQNDRVVMAVLRADYAERAANLQEDQFVMVHCMSVTTGAEVQTLNGCFLGLD